MKAKGKFFEYKLSTIFLALTLLLLNSCKEKQSNNVVSTEKIITKGEMVAELTPPPFVPKPVGNREATKLKVDLEIIEQEGEMVDGVKYVYWTFGGTVPGSL